MAEKHQKVLSQTQILRTTFAIKKPYSKREEGQHILGLLIYRSFFE